jgi:hypothetical protein
MPHFTIQLNFYGFRKLRTDPILTSDVDPRTACYVRFYHEKFQKDLPELLHQIKRATKSDQQSKDDVESLKAEVQHLKDIITQLDGEMERKLQEMNYSYNRRITTLSGEYEKLAALVQQILPLQQQQQLPTTTAQQQLQQVVARQQQQQHLSTPHVALLSSASSSQVHQQLPHALPLQYQPQQAVLPTTTSTLAVDSSCKPNGVVRTGSTSEAVASIHQPPPQQQQQQQRVPDLMHSLSQAAAMSLQQQQLQAVVAAAATFGPTAAAQMSGTKRSATEPPSSSSSSPLDPESLAVRPRMS